MSCSITKLLETSRSQDLRLGNQLIEILGYSNQIGINPFSDKKVLHTYRAQVFSNVLLENLP